MTAKDNEFNHGDGVTLKEYVETLNENTEKNINVAIGNIEHNTTLAKQSMEKRLDISDAKLDVLNEQVSKLITRDELKEVVKTLGERIEAAAKGKVSWSVAIIMTILSSLTLSLVIYFVTNR